MYGEVRKQFTIHCVSLNCSRGFVSYPLYTILYVECFLASVAKRPFSVIENTQLKHTVKAVETASLPAVKISSTIWPKQWLQCSCNSENKDMHSKLTCRQQNNATTDFGFILRL
jgi:hypothetical protein